MQSLKNLLNKIVSSSDRVQSEVDRRQSRLLNIFLLVMMFVNLFFAVVPEVLKSDKNTINYPLLYTCVCLIFALILIFYLNKRGFYNESGLFFVFLLSLSIFVASATDSTILGFMALPILVGSVFLATKDFLLAVFFTVLLTLMSPLIFGFPLMEVILGAMSFIIPSTMISFFNNFNRGKLEQIRTTVRLKTALTQKDRQIQAMIDNTSDVIMAINQEGVIINCSKKAQFYFGYTAGELVSRNISEIVSENIVDSILSTQFSYVLGKTIEGTGIDKNKNSFPIEVTYAKWRMDGKDYYSLVIRKKSRTAETNGTQSEFSDVFLAREKKIKELKVEVEKLKEQISIKS